MTHLVNRTDVWGQLSRELAEGTREELATPVTVPFGTMREGFLDLDSLQKHFKSQCPTGLLGVHCISSDLTARWFAIDIDLHDPDQLSVTSQGNFAAAQHWHRAPVELGFDPLLLDSNGRGGFHLLVLLAEPLGAVSVNAFVKQFVSDYLKRGLDQMPEVFPNTPRWDHYGDWLRLPGRHHTYDHYTRVWNDEPWTDQPWLEGHEAIDRLLATRPRRRSWRRHAASSGSAAPFVSTSTGSSIRTARAGAAARSSPIRRSTARATPSPDCASGIASSSILRLCHGCRPPGHRALAAQARHRSRRSLAHKPPGWSTSTTAPCSFAATGIRR